MVPPRLRLVALCAVLHALVGASPLPAQEACSLCTTVRGADQEPQLTIEIASDLVFSRLALTGTGQATAAIDPQSGRKAVSGMVDLGGQAVQGRARIQGQAHRAVRIILPDSVTMTSAGGGTAELTDFVTDLPAWPVLDSYGQLEFAFGGTVVLRGPVGGTLRGRLPISVEYN